MQLLYDGHLVKPIRLGKKSFTIYDAIRVTYVETRTTLLIQ